MGIVFTRNESQKGREWRGSYCDRPRFGLFAIYSFRRAPTMSAIVTTSVIGAAQPAYGATTPTRIIPHQ